MIDINNKEIRRELIARYLEAETTPAEENLLKGYYETNNRIDNDEQVFARVILMETLNSSILSDAGKDEYDRITGLHEKRTKRKIWRWIAFYGGIAASIAVFLISTTSSLKLGAIEIADNVQQMINLPIFDVESITATPIDDYVWIKAELKDGTSKVFIMNNDENNNVTIL